METTAPTMQQLGQAAAAVLAIQQGCACAYTPENAGSASPVGGEAAAACLPSLADETWEVLCHTRPEKQALFDYAERYGLVSLTDDTDYLSADLLVGVLDGALIAFEGPDHEDIQIGPGRRKLSLADFKAMCDAYAARPA